MEGDTCLDPGVGQKLTSSSKYLRRATNGWFNGLVLLAVVVGAVLLQLGQ